MTASTVPVSLPDRHRPQPSGAGGISAPRNIVSPIFEPAERPESAVAIVSELLTKLAASNDLDIAQSIRHVLERLGRSLRTDRAFVLRFSDNRRLLNLHHEWHTPILEELGPSARGVGEKTFRWALNTSRSGRAIVVDSTAGADPDAEPLQLFLKERGCSSLLSAPLVSGGSTTGFLCFSTCGNRRRWTICERQIVEAVAAMLGTLVERHRTAKALENTEKNLEALLNSPSDYVFILDRAGRILHSNPSALKCLGYSLEDLRGKTLFEVVPPGDARELSVWLTENANGNDSTSFLPLLTASGNHIPVETKVTTSTWNDHPVLLAVSRDIEDRIQALAGFKRYQARTMAVLEAIPDTILRLRKDATVIDSMTAPGCNDAPNGRLEKDLPKITAACGEAISRALVSGETEVLEIEIPSEDSSRTLECRLVVFGDDEILAIVRDISERARLEQMKTDFINRASHDLRTPLTTARLMVDLIQGGGSEEETQEYWNILNLELQRQNDLICTLLTAGRLERGALDLNCVPLDPLLVLETSLEEVTHRAASENLSLAADLPDSLPSILGDASALQRCFTNLLDNAIKYTREGGHIRLEAQEGVGRITVRVVDDGIGIDAVDLPHLFDRFFRAETAVRSEIPGTGIGLYIVKSLVEGHKGTIAVHSRPGAGTTFEISFPTTDASHGRTRCSL